MFKQSHSSRIATDSACPDAEGMHYAMSLANSVGINLLAEASPILTTTLAVCPHSAPLSHPSLMLPLSGNFLGVGLLLHRRQRGTKRPNFIIRFPIPFDSQLLLSSTALSDICASIILPCSPHLNTRAIVVGLYLYSRIIPVHAVRVVSTRHDLALTLPRLANL